MIEHNSCVLFLLIVLQFGSKKAGLWQNSSIPWQFHRVFHPSHLANGENALRVLLNRFSGRCVGWRAGSVHEGGVKAVYQLSVALWEGIWEQLSIVTIIIIVYSTKTIIFIIPIIIPIIIILEKAVARPTNWTAEVTALTWSSNKSSSIRARLTNKSGGGGVTLACNRKYQVSSDAQKEKVFTLNHPYLNHSHMTQEPMLKSLSYHQEPVLKSLISPRNLCLNHSHITKEPMLSVLDTLPIQHTSTGIHQSSIRPLAFTNPASAHWRSPIQHPPTGIHRIGDNLADVLRGCWRAWNVTRSSDVGDVGGGGGSKIGKLMKPTQIVGDQMWKEREGEDKSEEFWEFGMRGFGFNHIWKEAFRIWNHLRTRNESHKSAVSVGRQAADSVDNCPSDKRVPSWIVSGVPVLDSKGWGDWKLYGRARRGV